MTDPSHSHNPGNKAPRSIKYVLMLGALAALPALTTDMYLPSLPAVEADLNTTQTAAQLTENLAKAPRTI